MSQELVEKVRQSLEGWNRGDFDACMRSAHPDIEWISEIARSVEGAEAVYRGLDGMRRYWDEWHVLWDVNIEVCETWELGDTVLVFARVRTRGEASGVDLEKPVAYVFEFEDGLARRVRSYFDRSEALAAVGLPVRN